MKDQQLLCMTDGLILSRIANRMSICHTLTLHVTKQHANVSRYLGSNTRSVNTPSGRGWVAIAEERVYVPLTQSQHRISRYSVVRCVFGRYKYDVGLCCATSRDIISLAWMLTFSIVYMCLLLVVIAETEIHI